MILENKRSPFERLKSLRECIDRKGFARIMEAHNGLSGIIAETVQVEKNGQVLEYDGLWESSLTDSASKGLPDASIVGNDSRVHTINEILTVTSKPLIVDGDTGGEPAQFEYLVRTLERLGVSAVIIEDKVYPKRNSLDAAANQDLEDPWAFAEKIQAGKEIATTDDFMIISRLESLISGAGVDDAEPCGAIYQSWYRWHHDSLEQIGPRRDICLYGCLPSVVSTCGTAALAGECTHHVQHNI